MSVAHPIEIVRTVRDLRVRLAGRTGVALVPTMGALHEGHLALVAAARARAAHVVVSLFVNPTQFAPNEDFASYPRGESADVEKLASTGPVLVFSPNVDEMYPKGHATTVSVAGPALGLESDARPHFFAGVATIVTKLLVQVAPDVALFGEKDYQQLQVIKRFVRDLSLPVEIVGVPTVREADGLALSSRNAYLSAAERKVAPALYAALTGVANAVRNGTAIATATEAATRQVLEAGFASVDYIAVRDAESLVPIETLKDPARVLAAARLGTTRLIDNVAV